MKRKSTRLFSKQISTSCYRQNCCRLATGRQAKCREHVSGAITPFGLLTLLRSAPSWQNGIYITAKRRNPVAAAKIPMTVITAVIMTTLLEKLVSAFYRPTTFMFLQLVDSGVNPVNFLIPPPAFHACCTG
ncbi:MAG: hypothetical protein LBE75_03770 [Burkholderiales bacterium]|jgi:hypothetical protein|nr:hypothetical protein [Burkholderiales bacterium]